VKQTATHSERERFVADLIRHAPASDALYASRLMRYSGTFHRLSAKEDRTFAEERKLERVKLAIRELCFDIRCTVVFNGKTFHIVMPDKYEVGIPGI
jgi:hypothetical protein